MFTVEISVQSEAAVEIGEALSDSATYKIALSVAYEGGLRLKVNDGPWSAALYTVPVKTTSRGERTGR